MVEMTEVKLLLRESCVSVVRPETSRAADARRLTQPGLRAEPVATLAKTPKAPRRAESQREPQRTADERGVGIGN